MLYIMPPLLFSMFPVFQHLLYKTKGENSVEMQCSDVCNTEVVLFFLLLFIERR